MLDILGLDFLYWNLKRYYINKYDMYFHVWVGPLTPWDRRQLVRSETEMVSIRKWWRNHSLLYQENSKEVNSIFNMYS